MRIIAGTARGHALKAPKGTSTRPTQDRVRESLFNVLSNYGLQETVVADFFAGTGALALEALSRGAIRAVCVDTRTARLILENAMHCKLDDRVEVLSCPIEKAGARLAGQKFDYIFADPPYEKNLIQITINIIEAYDLLAKNGILIMEHHKDESPGLTEGWSIIKEQSFGYTRITYLQRSMLERS